MACSATLLVHGTGARYWCFAQTVIKKIRPARSLTCPHRQTPHPAAGVSTEKTGIEPAQAQALPVPACILGCATRVDGTFLFAIYNSNNNSKRRQNKNKKDYKNKNTKRYKLQVTTQSMRSNTHTPIRSSARVTGAYLNRRRSIALSSSRVFVTEKTKRKDKITKSKRLHRLGSRVSAGQIYDALEDTKFAPLGSAVLQKIAFLALEMNQASVRRKAMFTKPPLYVMPRMKHRIITRVCRGGPGVLPPWMFTAYASEKSKGVVHGFRLFNINNPADWKQVQGFPYKRLLVRMGFCVDAFESGSDDVTGTSTGASTGASTYADTGNAYPKLAAFSFTPNTTNSLTAKQGARLRNLCRAHRHTGYVLQDCRGGTGKKKLYWVKPKTHTRSVSLHFQDGLGDPLTYVHLSISIHRL